MNDNSRTLREIAGNANDGESVMANVSRLREAADEIERLRKSMALAANIIDKHLNTQREKVADASQILRDALNR